MLTATSLARQALAELDAPEPNRAPALLTAGVSTGADPRELSWDDPHVQAQVRKDLPANALTHRPHLIAACQLLDEAGYQAPGVRCSCGYGLGFVALAPFATGVVVAWSRRRLPPKLRQGGSKDFASVPGKSNQGWGFWPYQEFLARPTEDGPTTAAEPEKLSRYPTADRAMGRPGATRPILRPWESRLTFRCQRCGKAHTVLNVTVVREVLRAITDGKGELVLGQSPGVHARTPRYVERANDRGTARTWATRQSRLPARAKKLSPERRSEFARHAANYGWQNS